MRKFLECCAGIDIGKREITVTILTGSVEVEPAQQTQTFGTTVQELNRCLEWLLAQECSAVVMESTGTYWVPVWNVLHDRVAVIVANPEHVKGSTRRKDRSRGQPPLSRTPAGRGCAGQFRSQRADCGTAGSDSSPQAVVVRRPQRTKPHSETAGTSQRQDRQRGQRRLRRVRTAHSPGLVAAPRASARRSGRAGQRTTAPQTASPDRNPASSPAERSCALNDSA